MDTVFDPGPRPSARSAIEDGVAYGPGVTDMKSGLLAGLLRAQGARRRARRPAVRAPRRSSPTRTRRSARRPRRRTSEAAAADVDVASSSSAPAPTATSCSARKGILDLRITVHGADELDLREQVRIEENGDAAVTHLFEQDADDSTAGRVEGRRRLIEDEHPRQADERLRDAEPLLHPLRHAVDAAVARIVERDELEEPPALGGAAVGVRQPLVKPEDLVRRVPAREAEELGEVADLPARGTANRRARR